MSTVTCPECEAQVELASGTEVGEILVCSDCGTAAELDDQRIDRAVRSGAEAAGFAVERPVIELAGRCPNCRDGRGHAAR